MRKEPSCTIGLRTAALLPLLALSSFCFGQAAQAPAASPPPPGVEVNIQARPQQATVGDLIQLDVDVLLPKGYQAILPKLPNQLGEFAIVQYNPGPELPPAEGRQTASQPGTGSQKRAESVTHHRARIVTALYRPGDFDFPPLEIVVRAPDGRESRISSQPVKIRIQSVLTDKEPRLKDLKKQVDIPEPVRWLLWLSLTLLAAILAFLAWRLYRRRSRRASPVLAQPQIDPLVAAETDLRELMTRGLPEKGLVKQFYVILSDIVKRILEAGYGIQTVEKTTSEIMDELSREPAKAKAGEDATHIEFVLLECDLVKFAKYIPEKTEITEAATCARRILDAAKKLKSAASAAGQAAAAGVQQ